MKARIHLLISRTPPGWKMRTTSVRVSCTPSSPKPISMSCNPRKQLMEGKSPSGKGIWQASACTSPAFALASARRGRASLCGPVKSMVSPRDSPLENANPIGLRKCHNRRQNPSEALRLAACDQRPSVARRPSRCLIHPRLLGSNRSPERTRRELIFS